ncbi:AraC family transcriptional regulator [Flavimarina sp. Hel_I_48]|uniref:AraC family transcriptional regulator n=1 Tax=Flavimarina sp. Hel_I_48 TaxID=1392488 RepID=UPI0004DED98F|nr:helix-turn-helix domain-containing protein [Flavimarina sp. Hel_I_48]
MEYNIERKIVNYTLKTDPEKSNNIFSIHKNNSIEKLVSSDFLIPHRKDYYFFALILDVDEFSRHWIDMKPYQLQKHKLYFTEPSQIQLKEESCALHVFNMNFTKEFLSLDTQHLKDLPIIQNPHRGHMLHLKEADFKFLEEILENINTEYQSQKDWQHSMLHSYVSIFLIYCSRLYAEQYDDLKEQAESLVLHTFLDLVNKKYREQHEVSHYAAHLNISAGYLGDTVKQQSGKSAIAHIQERIVLEAKRLIYFTEESMKEIAFSLGFEDASYFNRFFKRHTAFTPMAYKKHIRKMYH